MRYFFAIFALVVIAVISILGFRGDKSTRPPIQIFPDMDDQAKYGPQHENHFFANKMDDRPYVPGSIPRGLGGTNTPAIFKAEYSYAPALNPSLYSGKDESGEYLTEFPIEITNEVMELGQAKYNMLCTYCHGASGDGNGITKSYGMIATASYHDDRLRDMAIGEIFNTITNGKGQMLSYADKVSPEERWAVIAYIRALQRAQNATIEDVPAQFKAQFN